MPVARPGFGEFLRSRRDRLSPGEAGIARFPGPRRVPGLRREELAAAAGLSVDYYSRLEQGRQATVSDQVLAALARALRLDEVERAHMRDLASPTRSAGAGPQLPDAGLLRLMADLGHRPVLLLGRRSEVLARNALLEAVLGRPLEPGASFVRYLFEDPLARQRIVNWADFASASVAGLRRELGRRPDDLQLVALVEDLRAKDREVARWWSDHAVNDPTAVAKRIDHPVTGVLSFDIEIVGAPHEPDQWLVVYTTPAGSETARALQFLASWGAQVGATS